MKIVTIVGARPQFIKVAPVSRVLRQSMQEILVHTGQHYDHNMADIFFEELNIPRPDYNLGVGSATHGKQTAAMLSQIEEILMTEQPDAVLVYGDTNSTLAASLAASKLHIPIFHIEAGLRSFNKKMPEEINRVLTDHVSELLFAPTETAVQNLAQENITNNVFNVGDVMYDAFLYNLDIAMQKYSLERFQLEEKAYYLATIHRAENTDDYNRLKAIFTALDSVETTVLLPLHPRTEKKLKEHGLYSFVLNSQTIKLIEPVSYLEMILLESKAKGIITDSGGVQKEAYFARVPCFTLRDETEWIETVEIGWNQLVNPLEKDLSSVLSNVSIPDYVEGLYGQGNAAELIVQHIKDYFRK